MLSVSLQKFDNKSVELKLEPDEYKIMIESLLEGFIKNYMNDEGVNGISLFQIEYFLFSLTQAWNTVVLILEIQSKIDNFGLSSLRAMNDIKNLQNDEKRLKNNLCFQLEKLAKIDIEQVLGSSELSYFKVDRDRYFKHFMLKEYEADLEHPRYPNLILKNKFPTLTPVLEEFIKGSLSDVQKTWFDPNVAKKTNLRPVPSSAFRFDSVMVKNTKWMTHQRQQKLIKDAIFYLTQTTLGGFNKNTK